MGLWSADACSASAGDVVYLYVNVNLGRLGRELQAALGPALLERLKEARPVDRDLAAIVIFYDTPTAVLRATDLGNGLRFSIARTICSANVPALLVKGSLIDVETFE